MSLIRQSQQNHPLSRVAMHRRPRKVRQLRQPCSLQQEINLFQFALMQCHPQGLTTIVPMLVATITIAIQALARA